MIIKTSSDHTEADITLLVEGTFPYVMGGVSSWVYQILCSFPQYKFAIIFLGSRPEDYDEIRYELPDNIIHLETHFLFSFDNIPQNYRDSSNYQRILQDVTDIHEKFKSIDNQAITSLITDLHQQLFSKDALTYEQFLYSKSAWDYITKKYESQSPDISFIDYFWSVRNMHFPIWQLIKIAQQAPKTKILHSASTGYAGLLGAFLHNLRQYPFILTEHGIYTKERRIDLLQSEWLAFNGLDLWRKIQTTRYLASLWIRFFEALAKLTYSAASPIISLFEAYQQRQIQDGANIERTQVIANGIDVEKFKNPERKIINPKQPVLCFVGRVIQIKDIKTFIRTIAIIVQQIPEAKALVVGSLEDDPNYAEECINLVSMLQLKEHITFLGKQVTEKILPQVDLLILSSISEGLPFVLLEGFAAGVPVVSTDVGACRELVYGKTEEDKALGKCGEIVGIANPKDLAQAALNLIQDPQQWLAASTTAIKRVNKYYSLSTIMDDYSHIYEKALSKWQG